MKINRNCFWVVLVLLFLSGSTMMYADNPLSAKDLEVFQWRHIGPWNFSGRITDVAVPKDQNKVYYVATASGGLWKTEDQGISFKPIFEKYGIQSLGNVEVAPSDPNVVYLATGEALHARSSAHGNGMWKSIDAGKTWTFIGLEKTYFIPRIAIDDKNPDIVYVAAEGKLYDNKMDCQRGLFKTVDGGKTWKQVLNLNDRGVGDFIIDPGNSDIIIAAAYKTFRRTWTFIDRQPGNFLYKSTDGGKTWKKLTSGLPMNIKSGWNGVTVYPKNPNIVYVRMDEEVNLGFDERENRYLFRSGRSFKDGYYFNKFKSYKINPAVAKLGKFEPIKAENEQKLVEELNNLIKDKEFLAKIGIDIKTFNKKVRDIYKKDKDIIGLVDEIEKTLKRAEEGKKEKAEEGKEEKKEDKSIAGRYQLINRYVLQVLYSDAFSVMEPVKKSGVVYRSDDQGETWKRMTEYKLTGGSAQINAIEAGYSGRIEVDPNDENKLYAVEVRVMVSKDGGKTFKSAPWNGRNQCHVDTRGIWIDPLDSDHILNSNDGGLSETWDGGKHWSQKETISAQQFYDVSVDNEVPFNVMGGTQDNGSWIGPSQNRNSYGVFPADWTYLPSGDGFYVVRDWWNPEYIYFESQFGSSRRMNFKTGEMIGLAKRNTADERAAGKARQRYQWDAPIVLSPHNPGIVYVCSQHIHRSLRRGDPGTWETISPDLSKADKKRIEQSKLTNLQYATVYTFAESPVRPGLLWAGTDDGNLQMSPDNGVTWKNITGLFYNTKGKLKKKHPSGAVLPFDKWVTRVEPSSHDVNVCYVTYSGYRTHNEDNSYIYVTHDMGKTWKDISQGMMNPVRDIEEDPHNAKVLYIATDYGIFVTIDRGKNWMKLSSKEPHVIMMDLDIQKRERDLAVATYGRGFYIIDIYPFKEFETEIFEKEVHLFDIQRVIKWAMIERRGQSYGVFARSNNPATQAVFYYYLKDKKKKVRIVLKDLEGNVLQELKGKSKEGLHRAVWNLRKKPPKGQDNQQSRRRSSMQSVDAGRYMVTLVVEDKEVMTKKLLIIDDPILK
jgi:photosystem II stability/assembly factor-like uncharacterized protein